MNGAQTQNVKPKLNDTIPIPAPHSIPSPTPGLVCKETNHLGLQKQPNNQPKIHLQDTAPHSLPSPTPEFVCKETNCLGPQKQPNNQPNIHLRDTMTREPRIECRVLVATIGTFVCGAPPGPSQSHPLFKKNG
jgi:hypothetical protein